MSETDAEFVEIMMEQGDWGPGSRMHRLALLARRGAEAAAEIERLRAALGFYAGWPRGPAGNIAPLLLDAGQKARAALAEEKKDDR